VQRFRGGLVCKAHRLCVSLNARLVFKAHRLVYHSKRGLGVIKKKRGYIAGDAVVDGDVLPVPVFEEADRVYPLRALHCVSGCTWSLASFRSRRSFIRTP